MVGDRNKCDVKIDLIKELWNVLLGQVGTQVCICFFFVFNCVFLPPLLSPKKYAQYVKSLSNSFVFCFQNDRKSWDVVLDVWGPRIMFVEHFCDKNAIMVVVDFGKLHFSNQQDTEPAAPATSQTRESDDEGEKFTLYSFTSLLSFWGYSAAPCVLW
jgi:hypothetical protein